MPSEDEDEKSRSSGNEDNGNTTKGDYREDDQMISNEPSSSSAQHKRKRVQSEDVPIKNTETNQFPSWVAGGSPAKFIDREQLMNMSLALENMALVHEMSLNSNFEFKTTPSNPIEKAVKECLHRAFWDKIREDVDKVPPDYTHAFGVLLDIKKIILEVIPEDRVRLRSEVEAHLDEALLKQQLDKNCLDVDRLSTYLVELMGRLCSPARDEELKKVREAKHIVDILRSICELLEETKVDMANFHVQQNRALIEAYSAEYELKQFKKVMETNPEIRMATIEWLMRHIDDGSASATSRFTSPSPKKRFEDLSNSEVGSIINRAYMELLDWNASNAYPATLIIDRLRLEAIAEKVLQLIVCTTCVLITCNMAGKEVGELNAFKVELKNQLIIITNDMERSKLKEQLELISAQCEKTVVKCYEGLKRGDWTDEKNAELRAQILAVAEPDNQVRKLMHSRINSFILSMISGDSSTKPQRLPAGVSMVEQELSAVTALFARIISHNRATFGTLYGELLKESMSY